MTISEISSLLLKSKKDKGVETIAHSDALILSSPRSAEACRESGGSRMYTFEPPIFVSRNHSAESSPRSASRISLSLIQLTFARLMPIGFFCGGFSSTAGYVPGNEARIFRRGRLGTFRDDHFPWASLVFIRVTCAAFRLHSAKPFGFGVGRHGQRLSAPSVLERCVTTSVPPPGAGQAARKQSRL